MKKIIGLFVLVLVLGCEKEVSLQYKSDSHSKIVLNGIISPRGLEVVISKSFPADKVMKLEEVYLNDATAVLYHNDVAIDTLVNIDDKGHFKISKDNLIFAEEKYELVVQKEGLERVSTVMTIPNSLGNLTADYQEVGEGASISLNFPEPNGEALAIEVIGYDSLGRGKQVYGTSFGEESIDCPTIWTLPRFLCKATCLRPTNPRIIAQFQRRTIQWEPREVVWLHRIKYSVSLVALKYESLVGIDFGETFGSDLGFVEPTVTESFVKGGYGFILPVNYSSVEINF